MMYVCTLIRSIIGIHNLINNKISIIEREKELLKAEEDKKKERLEKAKEKAEKQVEEIRDGLLAVRKNKRVDCYLIGRGDLAYFIASACTSIAIAPPSEWP